MLSTARDFGDYTGVFYLVGLGQQQVAFDGTRRFVPGLGRAPSRSMMTVDAWWKQIVFVNDSTRIRRSDIVLGAANKDGGAHVDDKLSTEYAAMIALEMLKLPDPIPQLVPLAPKDVQFVSLRQMAYELLNSSALNALTEAPRA